MTEKYKYYIENGKDIWRIPESDIARGLGQLYAECLTADKFYYPASGLKEIIEPEEIEAIKALYD